MMEKISFALFCGLFLGIHGAWFDNGVFYQVYPQSFKEGNGKMEGHGDFKGIIEKLDYIKDLGVDAIWLNPFYNATSHGYDIKDFKSIDSKYGTIDDFKQLISEAKARNLKIIMDFVPNHVSSEHVWFEKSVNRNGSYDDYFIWNIGKPNPDNPDQRLPPNNWLRIGAQNGESAWEWNGIREQYYFFQFGPNMPDLNLRNNNVKKELQDAFQYWLELGISGWRIDAISHGFEDELLRDEPLKEGGNPLKWDDYNHIYTVDQNETFKIVYEWREFMDNFARNNDREEFVIMTESYTEVKRFQQDPNNASIKGAHLPFFFNMIFDLDTTSDAKRFKEVYDSAPDKTTWVIGNHDQRRTADRVGTDRINLMNALLLLFGRATVTYYGEEIGMYNVCNFYNEALKRYQLCEPGDNRGWKDDMSRTPFQWDNTKNAGFSEAGNTYFPVPRDFASNNLKLQRECVTSHYNIFKDLVKIKKSDFFQSEELKLNVYNENVLYGLRVSDKGNATILVNMNGLSTEIVKLDESDQQYIVKFSMKGISEYTTGYMIQKYETQNLTLRPYEVLVLYHGSAVKNTGFLSILIGLLVSVIHFRN